MNGEICCILQVCCPPEARAEALAKEMKKDLVGIRSLHVRRMSKEHEQVLEDVSEYIFKHFDLAPAGTLGPLVTAITAKAKERHDGI